MLQPHSVKLFKERCLVLSDGEKLIQELSAALEKEKGTDFLTAFLCGTSHPKRYLGAYRSGQHNHCRGFSQNSFWEKRLCKCMYYWNSSCTKNCANCAFQERFKIVGDYQIADYEVPAYYGGEKAVGEIDWILRNGNVDYATEVKPYKGNTEPLVRMIAEILTYTLGYPPGKYQKAIAFFEKNRDDGTETPQQKEYKSASPLLHRLLEKAKITVFRLEESGADSYRICKLQYTAVPIRLAG